MPWLGSFSSKPQSKDEPQSKDAKKKKKAKRPENPFREDVQEGAQDSRVYKPHAPRSSASSFGELLREGGTTGAGSGAGKENATGVIYRPSKAAEVPHTSVATAKPVFSLLNRGSSTGAGSGADKENATSVHRPVQHHDKSGVIYSRSKVEGIPNASDMIYGPSKAAGIPHANNVICSPSKALEVPHAHAASAKPFFSLFKRRSSRTGDARRTEHNEKEEPQSMVEHSGKEKPQSMAESGTMTPHHAPEEGDKSIIGSPHEKKRSSSWVPSIFRARRKIDTKQPDPASAVTARAADGGGAESHDAKSVSQHDPQKEPATMQGWNLPNSMLAAVMPRSAQFSVYSEGKSWSLKNGTYLPHGNFTPSHLLNTSKPQGANEEANSSEACNESYGESSPGDSNTPTLSMSEQPQNLGAAKAKRSWSQNFLGSKSPTTTPQRQLEKNQSDWETGILPVGFSEKETTLQNKVPVTSPSKSPAQLFKEPVIQGPQFSKTSIWPVGFPEKETTLQNKVPVTSPSKSPAQLFKEPVIQGPQFLNGTGSTHYTRPPAHSTEMNLQQCRGAAAGAHGYQRDAQRHVREGQYETDVLARRNVDVAMAGNVRVSTSLMTPSRPPALYGLGARAHAHTYTHIEVTNTHNRTDSNCTRG
jgi:hypothetical protein